MSDHHEAKQATPHETLLAELLDSRVPKSEREHAAKREIERLTAERDDLRRLLSEWLRENSPGGWIDELRRQLAEAIRERDDLRRQLAEAEQDTRRFDWLAERLEDVQIDDANPLEHYHGDEEDVPYSVLWRRAIDAAMGASNA